MSVFEYRHPDGRVIEREAPIGKAPKSIRVGGKVCPLIPSMPARVCMDSFSRGEKPSISRQLPSYYGFRDREGCYREWMQSRGVEFTPERMKAAVKSGLGPTPAEQNEHARRRALKAGSIGEFDRKGRVKATSKRGEYQHISRGRDMGDEVRLDR